MEAYLGRPVDAGFEGYQSAPTAIVASIVVLLVATLIVLVGILIASSGVIIGAGVVMTAALVALPLARRRIPVRWVAVSGDQVAVLATVRDANNSPVATGVLFDGSLDEVGPHGGSSSAVTIGREPVWFLRSRQRAVASLLRKAA
jgi:hypothetical protein